MVGESHGFEHPSVRSYYEFYISTLKFHITFEKSSTLRLLTCRSDIGMTVAVPVGKKVIKQLS